MRNKELWLVEENHATVKPDWNWTAKSTYLNENAGKIKSVFVIWAALWAEKFGRCLETCRSWKNILVKVTVALNLEAFWLEFWMKGA